MPKRMTFKRSHYLLAAFVLIAFAFLNFARAALELPLAVGTIEIPLGLSWAVSGVAALMSVISFYAADHS